MQWAYIRIFYEIYPRGSGFCPPSILVKDYHDTSRSTIGDVKEIGPSKPNPCFLFDDLHCNELGHYTRFCEYWNRDIQQEDEFTYIITAYDCGTPAFFDYAKLKIEIVEKADTVDYISATPLMPLLEFDAELDGYDAAPLCMAEWTCQISYDDPPGSDSVSYTDETPFKSKVPYDSTLIAEWELDLSDSLIIGGKATVVVSATLEGNVYTDTLEHYIRDENPDDGDVIDGLDTGEKTVVETESDGFSQFDRENYAKPQKG